MIVDIRVLRCGCLKSDGSNLEMFFFLKPVNLVLCNLFSKPHMCLVVLFSLKTAFPRLGSEVSESSLFVWCADVGSSSAAGPKQKGAIGQIERTIGQIEGTIGQIEGER